MGYVKPTPEQRCRYKDVAEKWRGGCHNKARANGFCHVHGGVVRSMPDLTPTERKLVAALLTMTAEEYSNHGCNDFRLRKDAGLTDEEAREAVVLLEKWHQAADPNGDVTYAPDAECVLDWLLMHMFAQKLREEDKV